MNKYGVTYGTSLGFQEDRDWIDEIDLYGWYFGYVEELTMVKDKLLAEIFQLFSDPPNLISLENI